MRKQTVTVADSATLAASQLSQELVASTALDSLNAVTLNAATAAGVAAAATANDAVALVVLHVQSDAIATSKQSTAAGTAGDDNGKVQINCTNDGKDAIHTNPPASTFTSALGSAASSIGGMQGSAQQGFSAAAPILPPPAGASTASAGAPGEADTAFADNDSVQHTDTNTNDDDLCVPCYICMHFVEQGALLDNDAIKQLQAYKNPAPSKCKYGINRYQACDAATVMQQWTAERCNGTES